MASSSIPLSLLAKGIGQLSKNGHERLDVYLEPEDYYNLQSQYQQYQLQALRHKAAETVTSDQFEKAHTALSLHKTFLTRKGALLLFSEELAKKALEEERTKREEKLAKEKHLKPIEAIHEDEPEALRTCNDLSWAILRYGTKPEYRKKGMLQKLRTGGMISDKTLYRQNPLLPHLYKYASYNLSSIPAPYRVTRNMLLPPGNVPSYEFYRVRAPHPAGSVASREAASKAPPPSQLDEPILEPASMNAIQAVRYHETGEIQEVTYAELKPQEKQEILAELLVAAHEHQQHIRDTLELVMSTNRNRAERSDQGVTSSASSELMADMQRAILSLVESPVRQQMKERQRLLREQEDKLEEERKQQQLKEERKQKRREERKARKAAEQAALAEKAAEAKAKKAAKEAAQTAAKEEERKQRISEAELKKEAEDGAKNEEKRLKEERRRKRREEREARRKMREEKTTPEEKETAITMAEEVAVAEAAIARPPSRDESRDQGEHDRKQRRHRKHRHHEDGTEEVEDERKKKDERRQRRLIEKQAEMTQQFQATQDNTPQAPNQQPRVYVRATQKPGGSADHLEGVPIEEIYAVVPQDGVTVIEHGVHERPKLQRRMVGIPIPVPVNTPAVDMRSLAGAQPRDGIEYEEVIILEKRKRRKRSNASSADEYKSRVRSDYTHEKLRHEIPSASRSVASSQSSGPKQILFAPEMPDDGSSSHKKGGSFYGGRMPITSNLVKQTLSDKVSIISASQDSVSAHGKSLPRSLHDQQSSGRRASVKGSLVSDKVVPSIGIEPATPLNPKQTFSPMPHSVLSSLSKSVPGTQYLSPTSSISHRSLGRRSDDNEGQRSEKRRNSVASNGSGRASKKQPSKKSESEDDDSDANDSSSQSSYKVSEKSFKPEVASKSSQTTSKSSKKKSKQWLKGHKGPGSQSSSSLLKSSSTKKSQSTRGSLPSLMQRGERGKKASLRMPDGEYVSVGGSLVRSEKLVENETEESDETASVVSKSSGDDVAPSLAKPSLKSLIKDGESSTKDTRRVSFQDADAAAGVATDTEDEDKQASSVSDYDVTEEESEEADEWPAVQEEVASHGQSSSQSRPISSRSEKLTTHAQKVAAMVIKKQRPDSGLDEDAEKAADLWNKAIDESELTSDEEEEEDEWAGAKEPVISVTTSTKSSQSKGTSSKPSSEDEEEKKRREKLEKIKAEKTKEKEIRPSVSTSTPKKEISIPGSLSSVASSVSSVQDAFVSEIQRKASDLGIEPKDLDFQADVINKLEKSAITPEEVEVIHDVESGKHIVRSRRSSTSVSSVLTPSTVGKQPPPDVDQEPPAPKQKLVVDLNLEKRSTATPSRASSVTSSMTSHSPTSGRSSISQRRSSIPVDKTDVKLDYDVTSYESKLGDPKREEPTIQPGPPHVEPEKIKTDNEAGKPDAVSRLKATASSKGTDSVKSMQSSTGKAEKPGKQPAAATKGPQRKGQSVEKKLDNAEVASSVADSSKHVESQKSQKTATRSTAATEKGSKKGDTKKKPPKPKPKAAESKPKPPESVVSESPSRTTPEKVRSKTPGTPFKAGQAKEPKREEYMSSAISPEELGKQESIASISKSKKGEKPKKQKKKDLLTQVEKDTPKPPIEKQVPPEASKNEDTPTPAPSPSKQSETKLDDKEEDDYPEYVTPVSLEDDYEFVRQEETPEPEPEPTPSPPTSPAKSPSKQDDAKSQISEATGITEATGTETSSQAAALAAENEAEREAKLAAKQEREQKRAAAAEKRRLEVERKRKEKEDLVRKEKEEQERQEKMREELEAERKRREDAHRMKKEEAEREKQREKEEEELRQRRLLQQQERERKQQEEYRRKMEEVQKKKKEEEERKREEARIAAEEEAARIKEEEELMAQMEESEREIYAQKKKQEEEERKRKEEEHRRKMEEEAKIAMEQARVEAMIRAKQAAALEEKLKFIRDFFTEANGLDQTQNVNRCFTFSYFELMRMLGLDVVID